MHLSGWKRYFNRYFWIALCRFMLIPLFLFAVLVPVSIGLLDRSEDSMAAEVERSMRSSFSDINEELMHLIQNAQILGQETNIAQLARMSDEEFEDQKALNCYTLFQAGQFLKQNVLSSRMAENYYLISENNDLFLSESVVSPFSSRLYGSFYQIEGYGYAEWREAVFSQQRHYFFLPAANTNAVFDPAHLQRKEPVLHLVVPLSYSGAFTGRYVVYLLSLDELFSHMNLDRYGDGSFLYLFDQSGSLIAGQRCTEDSVELLQAAQIGRADSDGAAVFTVSNDQIGLTAVMGVSKQYFHDLIQPAVSMTSAAMALLFLAVLVTAVWMAYLQNKPLTHVVETAEVASTRERTRNVYQYIADVVTGLDTQRKFYEEEAHAMRLSLRGALLGRLLSGKIYTEKDAAQCRAALELPEGASFCAACIQLRNLPESEEQDQFDRMAQVNAILHRFFAEERGLHCLFYNGDTALSEVLFCFSGQPAAPEEIRSLLEEAAAQARQGGFETAIGLGVTVSSMERVGWSSKCARSALRLADTGAPVQVFSEKCVSRGPLFSLHRAQKLTELLSGGESRYVEQFLQSFAESARNAQPSEEELYQVFYGLRSTVEGVAASVLRKEETLALPEFEAGLSPRELILSFQPACIDLCGRVQSRQSEKAIQKQHRIIDYLQEHYANSALCAALVAEAFQVSEKYVFQVVKTCTGQSLGEYIEKLRLKKAEELLRCNVDIHEIPAQIGYNSINTFYKAFKRVYQVSPGKWRDAKEDSPPLG